MREAHDPPASGRGVLNLIVLRERGDDTLPSTVREENIRAKVSDLLGHVRTIDMRPVTENGRTSYLGTFDIKDNDKLRFEIHVQPPGEAARTMKFQRRFIVD